MRKKILFYKRFLQIDLLINGFFIAAGIVALYRYLQTNDIRALHLGIVGLGVLIFGLVIPTLIFKRIADMRGAIRKQTEETISRLVSGWMESYKEADGNIIEDPLFWANIALLAVEVFGENSKHPAVVTLMEFIPVIRQELKKNKTKKKTKKPIQVED
jgi:predicted membrane-bound mannosyltransferase